MAALRLFVNGGPGWTYRPAWPSAGRHNLQGHCFELPGQHAGSAPAAGRQHCHEGKIDAQRKRHRRAMAAHRTG